MSVIKKGSKFAHFLQIAIACHSDEYRESGVANG
jgi:hypothetical protein